MLKPLRILLFALFWFSCQPNVDTEFGSEPLVQYNDEAPLTKKSYCPDAKCDSPMAEEISEYDVAGKRTKMEHYSRNASGKLELNAITEFRYNAKGLLSGKVYYGRDRSADPWTAYDESEYFYENDILATEKTYFNRSDPQSKFLTGSCTYQYENGKKVMQIWFDAKNKQIRKLKIEYKNGVATAEKYYDEKDAVIRIFEHRFAGNRRRVTELLPNSTEVLAVIEKSYDAKGRLASEETKVQNLLLCAMTPGIVRYSYSH